MMAKAGSGGHSSIDSAFVAGMQHDIARRRLEAQTQRAERAQRYGKIGNFFGSRANAALYIVSVPLVLGMIALAIVFVADPTFRGRLIELVAGIVVAALGFIGGLLAGNAD